MSFWSYLWHWAVVAFGRDLGLMKTPGQCLLGVGLCVLLGTLSYVLIQQTIRRRSLGKFEPRFEAPGRVWLSGSRIFTSLGAASVIAALSWVTCPPSNAAEVSHLVAWAPSAAAPMYVPIPLGHTARATSSGVSGVDYSSQLAVWQQKISAGSKIIQFSQSITNDFLRIGADWTSSAQKFTENSPSNPKKLAYIYGDSMARRHAPLLLSTLNNNSWKIIMRSFPGCPVADLGFYAATSYDKGCKEKQSSFFAEVKDKRPDLILMMDHRPELYGNSNVLKQASNVHFRAWDSTLQYLKRYTKQVVLLGPAPELPKSFIDCVSRSLAIDTNCNGTASLAPNLVYMERMVAFKNHTDFIDVVPWFCNGQVCPPVIDNQIVYLDKIHPSNKMAESMARLFKAKLISLGRWPDTK